MEEEAIERVKSGLTFESNSKPGKRRKGRLTTQFGSPDTERITEHREQAFKMREIHKKKKERAQSRYTPKNIQMYLNSNRKGGLKSPRMQSSSIGGGTRKNLPSVNTGSAFDT